MIRYFLLTLYLFVSGWTFAQNQTPVSLSVSRVPDVLPINGKPIAYYELLVSNASEDSIIPKKLDVIDVATGKLIFTTEGDELQQRYVRSGIIYLEFPLGNKTPKRIVHCLRFEQSGKQHVITEAETVLSVKKPVILGPPLGAGMWTAVYEPSWQNGHRRVVYVTDGKNQIPKRFAIDFIKVDSDGKYANGDENVIANWLGYGTEVLAVADAVVSSIRDDFKESKTIASHPMAAFDEETGNYISLNLGNGQYAFYEHLQPGSIIVKPGQRVKKGEVIARLGFTGQTTGPHLHFHVADADSPLNAEGIPFVLEQFRLLGVYPDIDWLGKKAWLPLQETQIIKEHPSWNTVIEFSSK